MEAIYIEPPEVNVQTDEESGDEDLEGDLNHLPPRQLRAQAEIKLQNSMRSEAIDGNNSTLENNEELTSTDSKLNSGSSAVGGRQVNKGKLKYDWVEGQLENKKSCFSNPDYSEYADYTPVQMFELFWDDNLYQYLVQETQKYAAFKNYPDPCISCEELKTALSILILSGYNEKPGKRFYWDSLPDMANSLVKNSMRRNRFLQIMQFLHCADNNHIDINDKAWKIRPLMDKLKEKFLNIFVPEEDMNYDESMVKYYGRHSCKQFIRGKPIRFGFKMWCLNNKDGFLINFDLYQGKNPRSAENDESLYGKATAPLLMMLREFPEDKKYLSYNLYLDNLFTSVYLLKDMRDAGYWCTGTIRENRLPKDIPLPTKKSLQKKSNRGDHHSVIDKEQGIIFVRWIDNNVVTVASTGYGVEPLSQVNRYSRKEKKLINIPRPYLIGKYNSSMGGTDLMDENIGRHRIAIRSKKWWWSLFTWMLDVSIQNAWVLYKRSGKSVTQLQFRRDIVNTYLQRYGTASKGAGRPLSASLSSTQGSRIGDAIRYDRTDHLLISISNKKRRRCAMEGCTTSTRTMCRKCDVGLCLDCNVNFHCK